MPRGADRAARLPSVLGVIYLIFNEGYAATASDDLVRPGLCLEAQRLGRMLASLMPEDAEVLGLLALMEMSVAPPRRCRAGRRRHTPHRAGSRTLGPFADQPGPRYAGPRRSAGLRWEMPAPMCCKPRSPPAAGARAAADTDWPRIASLYDRLRVVAPSPVVDLNRAIAHSMAFGPKRASDWWTRSPTPPRCATTRHCRRRGGFLFGPVDWPRRVQNSRLRRR